MSRARTTPQMSRCTHGFRLQITLLNLSHRVPTPSVEPGTLPMDLLLQLENTYGPFHAAQNQHHQGRHQCYGDLSAFNAHIETRKG